MENIYVYNHEATYLDVLDAISERVAKGRGLINSYINFCKDGSYEHNEEDAEKGLLPVDKFLEELGFLTDKLHEIIKSLKKNNV